MRNCGFYHVKGSQNSTITSYVGKGGERRARVSMKNNAGEVAIHFEVTNGVGGFNVDQTALIFEHISIKKMGGAKSTNKSTGLNNKINSPGANLYENLSDSKKAIIDKAYNQLIEKGGKELMKK